MLYLKLLHFIFIFTLDVRNIIPSFNLDSVVEEYHLLHQRELEEKSAEKGALCNKWKHKALQLVGMYISIMRIIHTK